MSRLRYNIFPFLFVIQLDISAGSFLAYLCYALSLCTRVHFCNIRFLQFSFSKRLFSSHFSSRCAFSPFPLCRSEQSFRTELLRELAVSQKHFALFFVTLSLYVRGLTARIRISYYHGRRLNYRSLSQSIIKS